MADSKGKTGKPHDPPEGLAPSNLLDLTSRQLSFIQNIIDKTLVKQPQSVQAIVLFIFIFLFVYMVIFTTNGSFILSTKLRVPLTAQQKAALPLTGDASGFAVPQSGYQIIFNERYYGLNSNGQVRIDLSVASYLWALAWRQLSIDVRPPGTVEYTLSLNFNGFELEPIAFGQAAHDGLGAIDPLWELGGFAARSPARGLSLITRAEADTVSSLRLYIQSVTVSNKLGAGEVNATLAFPGVSRTFSLLSLAGDLGSAAESPLLVTPEVPLIQNYHTFFDTSLQPSSTKLSAGGQIKLVAPLKLLSSPATSETYSLPELGLGVPVTVRGSAGGRLVLQLAYPVDVIFFERRDTPIFTEKLMPQVAEKGYVPRLNLNSARSPGEYNVIYAGEQVPLSALKEVVGIASSNGVRLRSIQPQRHLSNGIQNQIQLGSSASVACLDPIDEATLRTLTQAGSDSAFLATVNNLPQGKCTQ